MSRARDSYNPKYFNLGSQLQPLVREFVAMLAQVLRGGSCSLSVSKPLQPASVFLATNCFKT